jgi:hypothetical protein
MRGLIGAAIQHLQDTRRHVEPQHCSPERAASVGAHSDQQSHSRRDVAMSGLVAGSRQGGTNSQASVTQSTALGQNSTASGVGWTAVGFGSNASGAGVWRWSRHKWNRGSSSRSWFFSIGSQPVALGNGSMVAPNTISVNRAAAKVDEN